jgi:hypothetical protein
MPDHQRTYSTVHPQYCTSLLIDIDAPKQFVRVKMEGSNSRADAGILLLFSSFIALATDGY